MRKSFTLIELLVVIVIIGIILAVVIPAAMRGVNQAERRECAGNLNAIDAGVRLCYAATRNQGACDTQAELVARGDLGTTATCPFGTAYGFIDTDGDGTSDTVDRATHAGHQPI